MKVDFLISEEVRPEANGKFTVLGLFPGNIVILMKGTRLKDTPEETPDFFEKLVFLVVASDMSEGRHKFSGSLTDPAGKTMKSKEAFGEADVKKGFTHAIILEMKPFTVRLFGLYTFNFFVDRKKFSFPFEIREQIEKLQI